MSYLREIMIRLRERSAEAPSGTGWLDRTADLSAEKVAGQDAPSESSPCANPVLEGHLRQYVDNLRACSDAMLQYEWAWLDEHLSSLNLSISHAEMRQALGGRGQVDELLQEAVGFQEQLRMEMNERGLTPASRTGPLAPMEHAWELTSAVIRQAWSIEPVL